MARIFERESRGRRVLRYFRIFGFIYVYLWKILGFVVGRRMERFFRRKVFLFFVTKRLKYDVEGGERGYIFHLSLDIKGRKDFFFFFF